MAKVLTGRKPWGRWLLIVVLVLLAIAYSIAWFVMKPMIEDFADNWVEQQRASGAVVEYSERKVVGFPLNFELVFEDPVFEAPGGRVKWNGEHIRLESRTWDFVTMLAMNRARLSAFVPGENTVRDPDGNLHQLNVDRSSRLYAAWNKEGVEKASLKLKKLTAKIDGEDFSTSNFVFAATPSSNLEGAFDLNLSWKAIDVPQEWLSSARENLADAPPAVSAIASGILDNLEEGGRADIPMPNALSLGSQPMLFGLPLN